MFQVSVVDSNLYFTLWDTYSGVAVPLLLYLCPQNVENDCYFVAENEEKDKRIVQCQLHRSMCCSAGNVCVYCVSSGVISIVQQWVFTLLLVVLFDNAHFFFDHHLSVDICTGAKWMIILTIFVPMRWSIALRASDNECNSIFKQNSLNDHAWCISF